MSNTSNSLTSLLQEFMRLEANSLNIIAKLSNAVTSSDQTIEIDQLNPDGTKDIFQIPSFGYLKNRMDSIDKNIQSLAGLGDSNSKIRMPDGTFKQIYTASVARDPDPIGTLIPPTGFQTKPNWFFANFLNPLLYVKFDISKYVDQETERVKVLRLILTLDTTDKKTYFNDNLKGKNDISYEKVLQELQKRNISWTVDDKVVNLDPSIARYSGFFDIINIIEDEVPTLINGQTVTIKNRSYRFNKLNYTDNLETIKDTKTLKTGDTLLVGDTTKYLVESVDTDKFLVKVKRISGYDQIKIGISTLEIYSPTFAEKEIDVNISYNENQILFLKTIDPKFEIVATQWSPGTAFFSNELVINTSSGNMSLDDYYKQEVIDFGSSFMSMAKEKNISSVQGELPDAPVLDLNSFKVVQINTHKTNTKDADEIKRLQSQKTTLQSELTNLDSSIDKKKQELNTTNFQSDTDKKAVQSELDNLIKSKTAKSNLYTSVVNDLVTNAQNVNSDTLKPKYSVRGFWPIPAPKQSELTNPQEVIQFEYSYRYLRPDGGTSGVEQFELTDTDGSKRRPSFSQWVNVKSDLRKRIYNESTGFFEWAVEDVEDADTPNINQLDIAISQGEKIEIKVRAVSEAGYPINPIISEWSNSIIVEFPQDLNVTNDSAFVLQQTSIEQSKIAFQNELASKGLDLHLNSSFTKGDRYWVHTTNDLASGFYDLSGNILSLFEKIKAMDDQIKALNNLISTAKGAIKITLISPDGTTTQIANNSKNSFFGGFYDKEISTTDKGAIISKVYNLVISNTSASTLELLSIIPGPSNTFLPASDGTTITNNDYVKRKFDLTPLALTSVKDYDVVNPTNPTQSFGFQSSQIQSQWLYLRKTTVGLDKDLYTDNGNINLNYYPYNSLSDITSQSGTVGGLDAEVWDTTFDGSNNGVGGGNLTEFCVHIDHPSLKGVNSIYDTSLKLMFPNVNNLDQTKLRMPPFVISKLVNTDQVQAVYVKPTGFNPPSAWPTYLPVVGDGLSSSETDWSPAEFPVSNAYRESDKYFIGRRTCGAYLFLGTKNYDEIQVQGSDFLARKKIEFNNAITIPLIFQYRLRDYKNIGGGWNPSGVEPQQISISKTIGIDILPANDTLFSFDINISAKLKIDTIS